MHPARIVGCTVLEILCICSVFKFTRIGDTHIYIDMNMWVYMYIDIYIRTYTYARHASMHSSSLILSLVRTFATFWHVVPFSYWYWNNWFSVGRRSLIPHTQHQFLTFSLRTSSMRCVSCVCVNVCVCVRHVHVCMMKQFDFELIVDLVSIRYSVLYSWYYNI